MTGIFGTSEGEDMYAGVPCSTLRVSDYLEEIGVVERIILNWI
jgi:hypothetical protein